MGDKPVPALLKALLTVDQTARASCVQALAMPAFEKLPKVPAAEPFAWPAPAAEDQENSKPKPKKALADTWKAQVSKYARALELAPVSERGALHLEPVLKDQKHGAMHACLLMCKLYEGELDLEEVEYDFGDDFADLD